ncbi:hypothetical protein ASZ90_003328 [hydrocarbon metagenome]|uniref:Phospholipase/carboxylesterase/thioesterase domain-containing protein n=1 Tax=hydrocarbon metagenome TaxID=938273 RepID=A0A0W8G179_9ZZZZ
MKQHTIQTTKTARYYTLGELNDSTDEIVFVFHGYAQLAKEFIQNFTGIQSVNRFIIAPEGLNKFYVKGFRGNVGASWMTKEDRENEIDDYINFLNNIYSEYSSQINDNTKITLFGFSQGCATASRWFVNSNFNNAELILWGSFIPPDINYDKLRSKLTAKLKIVIGDEDEFISEDRIKSGEEILVRENINYELIKYPGKHDVQPGLFNQLKLFS